jgi:hypothetical protein
MKQWIGDEKGVLPRPFFGKVHKKNEPVYPIDISIFDFVLSKYETSNDSAVL